MRPIAMPARVLAIAVGVTLVLVTSGCGLFNREHTGFVETMLSPWA